MYHCNFPGCGYITEERTQINYHHIEQKSDGGSDRRHNRIYLCPTCHTKIYIPEAREGMHTVKGKDSIIILGWFKSTGVTRVLKYLDHNGEEQYVKEIS